MSLRRSRSRSCSSGISITSTGKRCVQSFDQSTNFDTYIQPAEEIDSYLYQTVGQDGLVYIAEAMQLPLIRRNISGYAVQQEMHYRKSVQGDETEDLFMLLQDVKSAFPEVQGVSVGAILSNYQRVRVENV